MVEYGQCQPYFIDTEMLLRGPTSKQVSELLRSFVEKGDSRIGKIMSILMLLDGAIIGNESWKLEGIHKYKGKVFYYRAKRDRYRHDSSHGNASSSFLIVLI